MKIYSLPTLIIAAICLTIAISDSLAWVRRNRRKSDVAFILICLGGAAFCVFCAGEYNIDSPLQSVFWLKGETVSSTIAGFALFWFIAEETRLIRRRYVIACLVWASLAFISQVVDLGDLTWITSHPFVLRVPLPFGADFVYKEVERGPILVAITSVGFIFLLYLLYRMAIFRRQGRRKESPVIGIAIGFVVSAQVIDFLIGIGVIHFIFLLEYAWLGTILVVGLRRSNDFIEAEIAKRALRATDQELKESQATLSTIIDSTDDMIWSVASQTYGLLTFNRSFQKHFSEKSDLPVAVGMRLEEFASSENELLLWRERYRRAESDGAFSFELPMLQDARTFFLRINPLLQDGRTFGLAVFGQDISERKKNEALIARSLAEKEVLLQEVYHRTKNNMSVIISMLRLQSNEIDDVRLKDAFAVSIDRILSMSMVHDKLYETGDLSDIDLGAYLQEVALRLLNSYASPDSRPSLALKLDEVRVSLEVATSCGLIANELITNSLKYAFPAGRPGKISIQLTGTASGDIVLLISDDGIGPPPGFDIARDGHLGLRLIGSLARGKLRAHMEIATDRGLSCKLVFPPWPNGGPRPAPPTPSISP